MKRLVTVLLFFLSVCTFSQESAKPHWMFGGILGYSSGENTPYTISNAGLVLGSESSHTQFTFQPYLGRLINNRWIAGVKSKYVYQFDKYNLLSDTRSTAKTHTGSVGLFARYKLNPQNKLVFQLEPCYFLNFGEATLIHAEGDSERIQTFSNSWSLSPMATYAVAPRIVLAVRFSAIRYETGYWQMEDVSEKHGFSDFDFNLNINKLQMGVALLF